LSYSIIFVRIICSIRSCYPKTTLYWAFLVVLSYLDGYFFKLPFSNYIRCFYWLFITRHWFTKIKNRSYERHSRFFWNYHENNTLLTVKKSLDQKPHRNPWRLSSSSLESAFLTFLSWWSIEWQFAHRAIPFDVIVSPPSLWGILWWMCVAFRFNWLWHFAHRWSCRSIIASLCAFVNVLTLSRSSDFLPPQKQKGVEEDLRGYYFLICRY